MITTLILAGLLVSGNPNGPSAPLGYASASSQGMAATHHSAASDASAKRLSPRVERATGRTVCRRTDAWHDLNRRLESAQKR